MEEVNKRTRKRVTELITDEEQADTPLSGDFSGEGLLDYFRKAEIWIPTEVYADYVASREFDWYGLQFHVAFIPPEKLKVSWARVRLDFLEPVKQLGLWFPDDQFSATSKVIHSKEVTGNASIGVPKVLLGKLPYLKELLPQFSAKYHFSSEQNQALMESVIRSESDGQRRLNYDLAEDPSCGIDKRQLVAQVLFGIAPGAESKTGPLVNLTVNCRCGPLRLKSEICQEVDIVFRGKP